MGLVAGYGLGCSVLALICLGCVYLFFCLDTKEPKDQGCIPFLTLRKRRNLKLKKLAIYDDYYPMGLDYVSLDCMAFHSSAHTVYSF